MSAAAPRHLISKTLDPIFAVVIGAAAAASRVRREEKEKGRDGAGETWEVLERRAAGWWGDVGGSNMEKGSGGN